MSYYEIDFQQPRDVSEPLTRYFAMTAPRPRRLVPRDEPPEFDDAA